MEHRTLVNKEILFQKRKSIIHKNINKRLQKAPRKKYSRFRCWTCGLYKGDAELCKRCMYKNNAGTLISN